jgi:hypothetical protein
MESRAIGRGRSEGALEARTPGPLEAVNSTKELCIQVDYSGGPKFREGGAMSMKTRIVAAAIAMMGMVLGQMAYAQGGTASGGASAPPGAPVKLETRDELMAKMNDVQKQKFEEAGKAFGAQKYTDALAGFKQLLSELPGDTMLSKFASEAALNGGDTGFALATLKPLAAANPDDWQAAALLTRAYAESGDAAGRDTGIAHMLDLRHKGATPPGLRDYVVEFVKIGDKTLIIRTSLEPWGGYHVYAVGQLADSDGKVSFRVALESDDVDQVSFAKEHPQEAAKGMRRFSLDGYTDSGVNTNGQKTQSQSLYKFMDGQPSYAVLREEFIQIAKGVTKGQAGREGLVVP